MLYEYHSNLDRCIIDQPMPQMSRYICTLPNNGTCKNEIAASARFLIEMIAKLERTQITSTLVETKTGHSTTWLNNYNIILY